MKNWKTTLFGLAAGGLNLFANGMNWKQILLSLAIGAIGGVAKDNNVTGGTKSVPTVPNPPVLVEHPHVGN